MLSSILLRLVARSSDSLVAFVTGLDAAIDKFVAKHDAEVAAAEQRAKDILADAADQIKFIENEAANAVKTVENEIEAKLNAISVLTGIRPNLSGTK